VSRRTKGALALFATGGPWLSAGRRKRRGLPIRGLHAGEGDVAVEDEAAKLGVAGDGCAEGVQVHAGAGLLQRFAAGDGVALRVRVADAGRGEGARGAAA
jgi:hypothetical protein